jgi:hypothetical protein
MAKKKKSKKKAAIKAKPEKKPQTDSGMTILEKAWNVLAHPNIFYKKIKKETQISKVLIYFLVINVLIIGLWRVKYLVIKLSAKQPGFASMIGADPYLSLWLAWIPIRIIGVFMMAYILHLCVKLFTKKRYNFIEALKVMTYAETPYALFGWITPVVFGIWAIILYVKGTMKLYDFSAFESVCILVLATVIGLIAMTMVSMIMAFPFVG